jgi:transcriptional regulator with XRE-family HTH domain
MAHFGKFLKGLRLSKNLTQEQMAGKIGLKRVRYCNIEQAPGCFGITKLAKMAKALGFNVEIKMIDQEDKRNKYIFKVNTDK